MEVPSPEEMRQEAARINNSDEDDDAIDAIVFMIASLHLGPNAQKISRYTKMNQARCILYGQRLRKNKIWVGLKIDCEEWFDEKAGGVALILDAMVARGELEKTYEDEDGKNK